MSDVTRLLNAVDQGDPGAAAELLPLVYEELRKPAAAKMARQPGGQTLQATAMVHEAWLGLVDGSNRQYASRRHFFSAAAQAMLLLLDENGKQKYDWKRIPNPDQTRSGIRRLLPTSSSNWTPPFNWQA